MPSTLSIRTRSRRPSSIAFVLALLAASAAGAQSVDLADKPLFSTTSVPGNLLLSLSVEYPTANTSAYFSTTPYASATPYLGYFDGAKCYRYLYNSTSPASSYFQSYGAASANHQCASSSALPLWSGNYLNYAAMQSLDIFRWVMTGGNRLIDTAGAGGMTILQKATHSGQGGANDAPNKSIPFADQTGSTPFNWANGVKSRIWGAGIKLWLTGSADLDAGSITAVDYQDSLMANGSPDGSAVYALYMNVRVCDATVSLEANCVAYGSQSKPEGLMQQYAGSLRYSAFAYLNDSSASRDGGVMRARMAYIGPKVPQAGAVATANPNPEWDATTGVMIANPDPADATATNTATNNATTVSQSGVLNYLNKFGYASGSYKTYDPVSELYYASLRYLKGQTNVAAYTDMAGASTADASTWTDGFPVVTDWSTDPIIYACQKNFILGIGDVNTHRDANLPGSSLRNRSAEPARPPEVTADATGSSPVNVTASTNLVGTLENPTNTKLGSTAATGDHGTYYIAGLAYDAHLPIAGKGVRSFADATTGVTTVSTVSTYWLDVLEYQAYVDNNQYYYATKYGGFTVPSGYTYGGALPADSWYNSTNTLGGNKQPDNYFTANNATLMQSGLTSAFAKIASENNAANGTALTLPTPNVTAGGTMSYSATYDPTSWTGQVIGSTVAFKPDGTSKVTQQWDARALLSASNVTADSRRIVTCCTLGAGSPGLPFTLASLRAASLDARTNYASFGNVPGVAAASQSIANYIAYLRGDQSRETSNGGVYRTRKFRLGDIVDAKPVIVGPPNSGFYDTYNAGYAAFRTQYLNRRNVVYAGANDGMLHAFEADFQGATRANPVTGGGSELFAYVPSMLFNGPNGTPLVDGLPALGNLNGVSANSYAHHFYVDATPQVADADFTYTSNGASNPSSTATTADWHTILIGGLGKGGKGIYALDITSVPDAVDTTGSAKAESAAAKKVLWEFTEADMGYSFGAPLIIKTRKYGWVVAVTSGYNNTGGKLAGHGILYILNIKTGAILQKIDTGAGNAAKPAGLTQASAYTRDIADGTVDQIYAGDLLGNVWRFDLTEAAVDTSGHPTGNYPSPTLLATLTDKSGNPQPVTTMPRVEESISTDGLSTLRWVFVGTGKFLDITDLTDTQRQTMYALRDGSGSTPATSGLPLTRNALTPVTDLMSGATLNASASGWYYDLTGSAGGNKGGTERVVVAPSTGTGLNVVAWVTVIPSSDPCSLQGSLYAVNFAGASVLLSGDTQVKSLTTTAAALTNVQLVKNANGTIGAVASDTSGKNISQPIRESPTANQIKRVNWREVMN